MDRCNSRDISHGFDDPTGARNCPAPFPAEEKPLTHSPSHPKCECDPKEELYSQFTLGRAPHYELPRAAIERPPQYTHWRCLLPPLNETTYVGWWFSAPAAGECAVGEVPCPGVCGWAREARQAVVTGSALVSRGFDAQVPADVSQYLQASKVVEAALDTHGSRCCGC